MAKLNKLARAGRAGGVIVFLLLTAGLGRVLYAADAPAAPSAADTPAPDAWSGNMARNPGFEEDFVNVNAESHVISFKGDWYYNQKDNIPDYWDLSGAWHWETQGAHSGGHYLRLEARATASQAFPGASYQEGGTAWSAAPRFAMKMPDLARLAQPWRVSVWVRHGGTIRVGTSDADAVSATAPPTDDWELLSVELPAARVKIADSLVVTLVGPGEFDDVTVREKLPGTPNLIPNAGFEQSDANGLPLGWSEQRKYRSIGPTYYVFTDWNHFFRDNRGPVRVDPLVSFGGGQSLRFDVYPGDEKYVESDPIVLNQTAPGVIEVGVYVRADRIRLIDVRAVNEDGADLPGYYPLQPEYSHGGTATYGNGTFEWRYIRKFFAPAFGRPLKSIRVRLCARGFNGNTLDGSSTRAYCVQAGTLWWDNIYVTEPGTDAAALAARGVKTYPVADLQPTGPVAHARLDLGERLYGDNTLCLTLTNNAADARFVLRLTTLVLAAAPGAHPETTFKPGDPHVVTSQPVEIKAGKEGTLEVPYRITQLLGDPLQQGEMRLELLRERKVITDTTYAYNTWPVVVNIDVARHYNLPTENPVTASINLGVSDQTLARVAKLEMALVQASDPRHVVEALPVIADLPAAFAQTRANLPRQQKESYEFNLPTPAWWVDRTNLLMMKLDLSKLKVWPHDMPVRDTALFVWGVDAKGKELFEGLSAPFGRMEPTPPQPPIQSVEVRQDGAVLINGKPRFLFGVTHQNQRTTHTPEIAHQLGVMAMRGTESGKDFANYQRIWKELNLYDLQAKAVSGADLTAVTVSMTDAEKKALTDFAARGGLQNIVSFNTGGWESSIPISDSAEDKEKLAQHLATNDWVYRTTHRPVTWSWSGGYNAWNVQERPFYDIIFAETEMWGPMDYNTIAMPYYRHMRKRPSTWVYLPQLYDNTPYDQYRFETYENIIRGSAGVAMIQGIGDPTFNRGLAGELRYLEGPLNSLEPAPEVTITPEVSHKVTHYDGKTYVLATNAAPIAVGQWQWNTQVRRTGRASHEGDTVNKMWFRPAGIRIHGFRAMPMPQTIQKGDKIVQYVWLDPHEVPKWVMLAVRGDGKFIYNAVLGDFNYERFRQDYGNIIMYSELNQGTWHEINYVFDPPTYAMAVKLMGKKWADKMKASADQQRARIDALAYQGGDFHNVGDITPADAGSWVRMEIDADAVGLTGKLVDGLAFLTQNGRALWDRTTVERDGKVVRVLSGDTFGVDRAKLSEVRFTVAGLRSGTKIKSLFDGRTIIARGGYFTDNMGGTDAYQYEAGSVPGNMFDEIKDPNRELARMMPQSSGYYYPVAVRIYEIGKDPRLHH